MADIHSGLPQKKLNCKITCKVRYKLNSLFPSLDILGTLDAVERKKRNTSDELPWAEKNIHFSAHGSLTRTC